MIKLADKDVKNNYYKYTPYSQVEAERCRRLSVQLNSVAQLCPTLCNPMDCSMPDFPIRHQALELAQTHVH